MNALPEARVAVAMLGARMHYAVPRLLFEAGLLERFFTDSYIGNKPLLRSALRAIPAALRPAEVVRWLGRDDNMLPREKVVSFELLGLWYAIARRRAETPTERRYVAEECTRRFSRAVLSYKASDKSNIVWGFNSAALPLFEQCRSNGQFCILEQCSYPERLTYEILKGETDRWPDWEPGRTWHMPSDPLPEEREWALADIIVCASEFVRSGLRQMGIPEHKIRVVPYGVDHSRFSPSLPSDHEHSKNGLGRPINILFAGRVGLWKGVPYLLEALKLLPSNCYQARIVGGIDLNRAVTNSMPPSIQFTGALPRHKMPELFQWADVLVCPSLSEGSATVTYEALMSGVPVIATPNAGSPVRDGKDGILVPVKDAQSLANAVRSYLSDPDLLRKHRSTACKDRLRLGWDAYRDNLTSVVHELTQNPRFTMVERE